MFAGHVGAALALGRAERRVNVGAFVVAALLLDIVLWLLVLAGWESLVIPADFASTHQPEFVFPYSHGLLASIAWSLLAAVATAIACARLGAARWRAAALVGAAVFSHWILDALVHRPELPLAGTGSPHVGLGLWQSMPVALITEAAVVAAGLWLFVSGSRLPRGKLIAMVVFTLTILVFTVAGMTVAPPPPSVLAMAASSLASLVIVCALVWWLGRPPQ
ncbi:hypothetical protein QTI66_22045 [Variovorax sp. J22R133]|uniref:hypothetical protein n=1 Tax=Variovorax brevis TaxID=3053503 RepID=UPI00257515B5|nr:hypothetical protein [Variovorax sp. J22R133]MDM0114847.1 hypothetical protein [Variovorax sp. J22R133]